MNCTFCMAEGVSCRHSRVFAAYLQCQAGRPQHLDPGEQEAPEIQDIVVAEERVDVCKGLTVAQYGVDGVQCMLLVGGEVRQGGNGLEGGVLVGRSGHGAVIVASFGVVARGLGELFADRGE
jgi:hypothetical protein